MHVCRTVLPQSKGIVYRCGCQSIFARSRNQSHTTQRARQGCRRIYQLTLRCTNNFKIELRNPVAIGGKLKILDHDIGQPSIGWGQPRALDRFDLGIGKLTLAAGIDAQVQVRRRNFVAIRPNPADPQDFTPAKPDRQADGIAVVVDLRFRRTLARTSAAHGLGKLGCPDHLPSQPHPAPKLTDRGTLARAGQTQPVNTPDIDRVRSGPKKPLVDCTPKRGTNRPTNHGTGKPQNCATKSCANGRSGGGKN